MSSATTAAASSIVELSDSDDVASESSSETCFSLASSEDGENDTEVNGAGAGAVEKKPPAVKIERIVIGDDDIDIEEADEKIEAVKGDKYASGFIRWELEKKKKAAAAAAAAMPVAKRTKKQQVASAPTKTELPTSMEMAKSLKIDWIGAIDPGITNCAICIVSAQEARVVYWRVVALKEFCEKCEAATGILLRDSPAAVYSMDAMMYAISWWTQSDDCPLRRCDLIVIERQSFMRDMAKVEATWVAAFSVQKPAVVENCTYKVDGKEETYVLHVPKAVIISSDTVKTKFKGFFPMIDERAAFNASLGGKIQAAAEAARAVVEHPKPEDDEEKETKSKRRKRTYTSNFVQSRVGSYGIGDSHGDPAQYAANKANSKYWCRFAIGGKLNRETGALLSRSADVFTDEGADDFEQAAIDLYQTMTATEMAATTDRLATAKSDDLADAFFMAFYAADFIVGSIWRRLYGPTAKRHTTRYVYGEVPPTTMNAKVSPEARHQTFFAYIKGRVKLPASSVETIKKELA